MLHLLHLEWLKLRKYKAFWILLSLYMISFAGIIFLIYRTFKQLPPSAHFIFGNPFEFPVYWDTFAFWGSIALAMPAIIVIMLTCNEYAYRTHRQNIIDGMSRAQFVTGKWLLVLVLALFATLCYFIAIVISGALIAPNPQLMFTGSFIKTIALFFHTALMYLSFALLIALLVKRSGFAIGIYILYAFLFDNVIYAIFKYARKSDIGRFLPFESVDGLIPNTLTRNIEGVTIPLSETMKTILFGTSVGYIILFVFLSYRLFQKRDL
jgi:ABC-2 type transport system permease protein